MRVVIPLGSSPSGRSLRATPERSQRDCFATLAMTGVVNNKRRHFMRIKKPYLLSTLIILSLALIFGCAEYGKIDQGRVIAYDKEKSVVTFVRDAKEDPKKPDYSTLPPHVYDLSPAVKAGQMGPEPKAGKRMKMDPDKKQIIVFDDATQNFLTITYTLIDHKENVGAKDPLVFDVETKKAKKFPVVNREKKTITVYSRRLATLTTFTLPDEYFARPDSTWDAGDEVRVYYKEPGKALKLMNISKTDIYKK